jgi:single-strand DNA-binding protein
MNTNSVVLVGNLVDAPEVQVTQSGAVRTRIRVAHTERRRDPATETWSDGESVFVDVVSWRRLAENTGNSLAKGDRVIVVGRLRQWTADRDGNRRTVLEIEADTIGPDLQRGVAAVARPRRALPGEVAEVPEQAGPVPGDAGTPGPVPDGDAASTPGSAEDAGPESEWAPPFAELSS